MRAGNRNEAVKPIRMVKRGPGDQRAAEDGESGFAGKPAMEGYFPHLLSRLMNRLNLQLLDEMAEFDISTQQWRVLQFLSVCDGATINEIAADVVLKQPHVSRIVAQLEARGLARRKKNASNARYVHVFLTERGRAVFAAVMPIAVQISEASLGALDSRERMQLLKLLQRVFDGVNRKRAERRPA